jgi:ribonuclease HII
LCRHFFEVRHPNDSKLRSVGEPSGPRFATDSYPRNSSAKSFALRIAAGRGHHDRMSRNGTGAARLPLDEDIVRPTFRRERSALKRGVWPVAGCDEAGRGPLAGPVVAAAVILDPARVPRGLDDSKKLDAATREKLYAKICASAQVAVAMAPPSRIDRDNILRASLWALARAVAGLPVRPLLVFVDGRDRIATDCECQAVIGGDGIVASIAAASIVAKVTRDRLMARLGAAHPGYGFERHMGYSVPEHFAALDRLGPTIHHRRSFSPVAIALGLISAEPDDPAANVLPLVF